MPPRSPHPFAGSEFGPPPADPKGESHGWDEQTNGKVERFNGRIADVLKTHHFDSALDWEQTLHRYVTLYNDHLPQSAIEL
jgi:hypothetical protein